MIDVLIVGAGPAGMSAALDLQALGLSVEVVDDQPAPGGRIFAAIETRRAHGSDEVTGRDLVARFRDLGGGYHAGAQVWQIEPGPRVFLTRNGRASMIEPRFVLLATGAQERPTPFPGWQLPGVMTVGAAQILLKTARQIPAEPVWLAGSGPLLLLYARQLLAAGGDIAGILDATPPGRLTQSAGLVAGALAYGWRDLLRGFGWTIDLGLRRLVRKVVSFEAVGSARLEGIAYTLRDGRRAEVPARLLFVHDGVIPGVHSTLAAGCAHRWNGAQRCFEPVVDDLGRSSVPGVFVAGDGAGIAGWRAAIVSGRRAAVGIASDAGVLTPEAADRHAGPLRRSARDAAGFRRLVDSLYPPVELPIPDETIVCRCEEVTAGEIRAALIGRPRLGPDGVKAATRAGMGPCQGRQCGASLNRLVSETHGVGRADAGFLNIRPPLKPLTLAELAALDADT